MFTPSLSQIGMFIILDWTHTIEKTATPRLERVLQF